MSVLQLEAFLDGFYDIIPRRLISIFNEQELELLISGLPTIDIDDLKANSEYHKYTSNSLQVPYSPTSMPITKSTHHQPFILNFLLLCIIDYMVLESFEII